MPSSTTVADARSALWQVVDPSDINSSLFVPALNLVSERIINSGNWKNMDIGVEFLSTDGYITLPRRAESIKAFCVNEAPRGVYARIREFTPNGPGFYDKLTYDLGSLTDQGEFPTQGVQSEALTIRLTLSDVADVGKVVRLYGVDANGDVIFDSTGKEGVALTLANPTVDSSVVMIVTGVAKAETVGEVTISTVDGGTVTTLSTYEPSETRPLYRRYKVGTLAARSTGEPVIRALCKRRFVKLIQETDLVYPSDLGALRFGLLASRLETQGIDDLGQAETYWQKCYQVLNQGLKQQRGGIRKPLSFTPFNNGGNVPRVH